MTDEKIFLVKEKLLKELKWRIEQNLNEFIFVTLDKIEETELTPQLEEKITNRIITKLTFDLSLGEEWQKEDVKKAIKQVFKELRGELNE